MGCFNRGDADNIGGWWIIILIIILLIIFGCSIF